jgi:hypothetical protein
MTTRDDGSLQCDMELDCTESITHLDEKGFIYCHEHGVQRQEGGWKRCRKLRPLELNRLRRGEQVARY